MKSYMKYYEGDVEVIPTLYFDGNTALQLVAIDTGEPVAKATVNIPEEAKTDKIVFIKDYAENEGVLETLVKGNILRDMNMTVQAGYTVVYGCRITSDRILKGLDALKERTST